MSDAFKYLDDTDIERLIADVEKNELVKAPDRIKKNVLLTVGMRERKIREYKRSCLQVALSVAAAAVILVLTPLLSYAKRGADMTPEVPSREIVLNSYVIPSKEEVMAEYETDLTGDLKKKIEVILELSEDYHDTHTKEKE